MAHAVVILAAGLGTRMKSRLPKVLHPLLGKPLVGYCIDTAFASGAEKVVVVVGHGAEQVRQTFAGYPNLSFVVQEQQLGTAHALAQAQPVLADFQGPIVVTQGDTPLTRVETLTSLVDTLQKERAGMALLTMRLEDPTGYGRILRDEQGQILANVEQKDATPAELAIQEINPGVYCFDASLWEKLKLVDNRNAAGEYYLPDLIRIYREAGQKIASIESKDTGELLGVNSRAQLAQVERVLLERLRSHWMAQGVRMIQPETIYLEPSVELAPDVTLWPGVILRGHTRLGEGVEVGAYAVLIDTVVEAGGKIKSHTVCEEAYVSSGADAGPFARLRPKAHLEPGAHVGNFVELKNARLGRGAKAGHLAYLGDAEVGEESNIGAGVITANYDGQRKHKTIIGKRVFVGSNSVLIAPIRLEDDAFVAGGSGINQDVPAGALAIARERQRNIEGYVKRKRGETQ
ncbi:bifunctional UDP-N-acetylglucosamine diphosphorylase/glucosamine-1-phosphate N-acetyltransferase GlmU [Meiothermus taiwanensis]|uniref:Bifunctional protein GlmU n=2 Tax=Meiothermus taiwanensis TaxID=172827 RepID=A0A399E6E2_9DEIN|nr:bifunctional UDP-N-acetylglucosamine diphosphorylase/glucosamine-1-phosphate N-acetyltransferase GlmU [Meiothermus taiwanensis]AWR86437.1 UDP-N-acetylglucosamine pyrophosphorylase [Meiothermus taiwanensis WR-220]KIQ55060.1 N-acetylglucosamine-1-phosphate uridyltransferase [Meiothermus taiwanensis]KZK15633.1 bifunctional N-acetylglucosamine-1-phosphate uridyltransferase/glucosamine-1-phosphate acetyltransferase [Meiothermus taiwanensis]RIH78310.1 Bifunctional protein GlmU [Meiothermus taiwane